MTSLEHPQFRLALTAMVGAAFLVLGFVGPTEARSPRGYVKHHIGKAQEDIGNAKDGLKQAVKGGEQLKTAHKESKTGFIKLSDLEAQLKQAAQNIKTLKQQQTAMAKQIAAMPPGTPGRTQLQNNMKSSQAQTNTVANTVSTAQTTLTKAKPILMDIADQLKEGAETFDKNKGTLKKIKNALSDASDVLKAMKNAAKWLPNAPNISQLK